MFAKQGITKTTVSVIAKGFAPIGEQFAYAAANFLVTAMLARCLLIEDFAAYASGYAIVMLLTMLHQGALCDGIFVKEELRNNKNARRIWLRNAVIIAAISGSIALVAVLGNYTTVLVIGFLIFAPASLNQYLRRFNQANKHNQTTLTAAFAYFSIVSCTTWYLALIQTAPLNIMVVPQLFGYTAAIIINARAINPVDLKVTTDKPLTKKQWQSIAAFSLIMLLNNCIAWLPSNIYQWLFFARGDAVEASVFRIIQTTQVAYFLILAAISGPLSQHFKNNSINQKTILIVLGMLILPIVGAVFFFIVGSDFIRLIFGAAYADYGFITAVASLCLVPTIACSLYGMWLRARDRTFIILLGSCINVMVLILIGMPYSLNKGLIGVWCTIALGALLSLASMYLLNQWANYKNNHSI